MPQRRAFIALFGTLVLYGALVAAHAGEFWPFSVYPMFSRAGQPWQRIVVRELAPADTALWAAPRNTASLPGQPFALGRAGIRFYDLTELVGKTTVWDAPRRQSLRHLFGDVPETRPLLLVRARGRLVGTQVQVAYTPFALLTGDTIRIARAPLRPSGGLAPAPLPR